MAMGLLAAIPFDISTSMGENVYTTKAAYIEHHGDDIKTLVVGSCLASFCFNSLLLGDSAYNTGIAGQSLFFDVEFLKREIPRMENLRTLIYPLHYNLHLSDSLAFKTANRAAFLTFRNYRYWKIPQTDKPWEIVYHSALAAGEFTYRNCQSNPDTSTQGYMGIRGMYYNGKADLGQNPPMQPDTGKCIALLQEIAKLCYEKNIRFIVVVPPMPDTYINYMSEEGRNNLQLIADAVKDKYPMAYKNYLTDADYRNDSLYLDWNHLNHEGATLFAQRVKEDFDL